MLSLMDCAKIALFITILFVDICFCIASIMALVEQILDEKERKNG